MADVRGVLRSTADVRLRIAVAATVVAGVALLGAGAWLVNGVEGSLTTDLRTSEAAGIARVREALQAGAPPENVLYGTTRAVQVPGQVFQVLVDGRVIASSPSVQGQLRLDSGVATAGGQYAVSRADVETPGEQFTVLAASPLDPVRRSVAAVKQRLAIAFPLLVAAVGLLTWFLTGRALRPVESIRSEVESISASTLSRRVPVPGSRDEVARLAHTMNAMLDRLESSSLRQQQFVADASHELRSPVAAIRTELEVARRTATPEEWPAVVDQVLEEEARLEATITDLLLLASLDEADAAPASEQVDLAALVSEEVARVASDDPKVAVGSIEPASVVGQSVQLRRAVQNLLDNARRHAVSIVRVGVSAAGDGVVVTVDDDGPGIPPEDRDRVFERFTRLDGHRSRVGPSSGAGLGLSLVRRIVERHGGTVDVDRSVFGGASFRLWLPPAEERSRSSERSERT